ncbi:MAG: phosphatidylserine decarboxylase family protein [Deltaproteobacteria bacterium]|nr:phosphatidylserine decarboxylase family protein [Deltaproteobacteria bacterium]MBW1912326.1 phosphatidylserine decarboxylase family protein [Deltaproteobacteria bacterium]
MVSSGIEKTRIENRLPVAREGIPFILIGLVISILLISLGPLPLGVFFCILTLFTIYFFRDPERTNNAVPDAVLSPADGWIIGIRRLDDGDNPLGEPAIKVSIFMTVFNVHVNRIPISGRISKIAYHPGRFFSANLDKASEENEKNRITLETDKGGKVVFVQIAGLIARRIVCWIEEQDRVRAGQRFGLIRFGSRLDVYLPAGSRIVVLPQSRVKAGESVLGYMTDG